MALIVTSTERAVALVYTGDTAVELKPDALQRRLEAWRGKQAFLAMAEFDAAVKKAAEAARKANEPPESAESVADRRTAHAAQVQRNLEERELPRVWVSPSECERCAGATVAQVRPLSWLEDQETQNMEPAALVRRVVELALISIDGDAARAAAFKADPAAPLMAPLYQAVMELTWGNSAG